MEPVINRPQSKPGAARAPESSAIDFRPVTSGLGFHPFSDGLPYAPVTKNIPRPNTSPATGATQAGPVSYARTLPRVNIEATTEALPPASVAPSFAPNVAITAPAPAYGMLYLLKRAAAYALDTILNLTLLCAGLVVSLWNQQIQPEIFMNPSLLVLGIFFCLLFNWALITAQEVTFSTSIGKRIFGLALRGGTGALFLRAFFFVPSVVFCGIGLAWGIFDRQRRCWHDRVAGVQPVEIAKL